MNDETLPDVCVVTHPLAAAGENATRSLLDILASITGVALITANLPDDSVIREQREFVELTSKGAGDPVPVAAVRFVLNQFRMCNAIRRRPEQVMLFFGATSYLVPILFARLFGKTVLVEPRGDVPLTLRINWERRMPDLIARSLAGTVRLLERTGFAVAHGVVTYTPNMARELGLDPESDDVYPHGARYVDTETFYPEVPFEDRDDVVGFVGRLDEEKGIRELAEVAKQLPDGITFRFVGDGPLYGWLESELSVEIEAGSVELIGWVDHDDVLAELNRMKLLVMPSQPTEGLPTTILEAMACGTPVLASPVSGVPDVVRDGETGFHIESRNPAVLFETIETTLRSDSLSEMSCQGRESITSKYSQQAATKRYRTILDQIQL